MAIADRFEDPRSDIGAAPIAEGEPAGESVRDDAAFDALEGSFRRFEAEGPSVVDWRQVTAAAADILSTRSKDLLVAAWLAYALFRTEGYRGLAVGIAILDGMVATYWDTLQPPKRRERGRVAALDWLAERLEPLLQESPPAEADDAAVIAASDRLESLADGLDARLEKEKVALGPLARALREASRAARARLEAAEAEARRRAQAEAEATRAAETAPAAPATAEVAPAAPAPTPPDAPAPATPAVAASGPAAAPEPPARQTPPVSAAPPPAAAAGPPPEAAAAVALADGGNPAASLRPLSDALGRIARALRLADPSDPRAYHLARAATFLQLRVLPPANGGAIGLSPPPPGQLASIEAMRAAGNAAGVLAALEDLLPANPFWLDGQHQAAGCLETLGHREALQVAEAETLAIVRRFPALLDLTFNDGTPLAAPATRDWLASLAPADGAGPDGSEAIAAALGAARASSAAGDARAGLALLVEGAARAAGGRERLRWQLAQASFCLEAGLVRAAVALLSQIDETVETYRVAEWEPGLAVEAGELVLRALAVPSIVDLLGEDALARRREEAFSRLARVDAAAASLFG